MGACGCSRHTALGVGIGGWRGRCGCGDGRRCVGTALAKVLAEAGTAVTLWARRGEVAEEINATRCNTGYLPGVQLPSAIRATADAAEALSGASTVLLGVPAQTMRANVEQWAGLFAEGATLVSLAKGIELNTLMRMSQVIVAVTGVDPDQVAVVSGPNLASEIAQRQPAATVVACSDSGRAVALQRALNTGYFRPYTNADVIGTEIGGACKNVIALACGMAAGAGSAKTPPRRSSPGACRDHAARDRTGSQGCHARRPGRVGDLVATCTSRRSRNRSFGECLAGRHNAVGHAGA
ncbi:NAD-dependent glycerol-3-phosphate dehydrogenase family protein [Mycobacterium xenopi 4042]|uniref:Glycerol-3-phosphate dehydrogenase n=1 Tax=Mycobacterium xenopi 4042 TaxID=1299334 RepID=X7Z3P5_MYCXE|nr:NAD-dependent glycerol-3-phosphate dehydrogenase family protein [Mycobacterium xenopi 4042]